MKKLLLFISFLIASLGIFTFTACGESKNEHTEHTVVIDPAVPATCMQRGLTAGSHCSVCNEILVPQEEIPLAEHTWTEWTVTEAASCSAEGKESRVCAVCNTEQTRVVDKLDEHVPEILAAVAPTCQATGLTEGVKCALCGTILKKQEVLERVDHDWQEWTTVAPTCTAVGYASSKCSFCGLEHQAELEMLPHTEIITPAIAATCESDGKTEGITCSVCGLEIKARETITKLGHAYGDWTYTDNNQHERICRNDSSHKETGTCEMENSDVPATCTQQGVNGSHCKDCRHAGNNTTTTPALGHEFGNYVHISGTDTHSKTCNRCKTVETAVCTFNKSITIAATCEVGGYDEQRCTECDNSHKSNETGALGHKFSATWTANNDGTHSSACTREGCNEKQTGACSYTDAVTPATCTASGYTTRTCSVCNDSIETDKTAATGHKWAAWTHKDDDTHSRICLNDASHSESGKCTYETQTIAPTCTEEGYTAYNCTVCHYYEERDPDSIIAALGHNMSSTWTAVSGTNMHAQTCSRCDYAVKENCKFETKSTVAPTCVERGYDNQTCSICNNTRQANETPAKGHTFGAWQSGNGTEHSRSCSVCPAVEKQNCVIQNVVTYPTCTAGGYTTSSCSICKYSAQINETKAYGHNFTRFDAISGQDNHTAYCTRTGCGHFESQECNFNMQVVPATCEAAGYTSYECRFCTNTKRTEGMNALGHQWSTWEYVRLSDAHRHTCTRCSKVESQNCIWEPQDTVVATCGTDGYTNYKCSVCQTVSQKDLTLATGAHKWDEYTWNNSKHSHTCSVCRLVETQGCTYDVQNIAPTCTAAGKAVHTCTVCNHVNTFTLGSALGHQWGKYMFSQETNNGSQISGTHTRTCMRDGCNAIDTPQNCNLTTSTGKISCTEPTKDTVYCSVCLHTFNTTESAPIGHQWNSYAMQPNNKHNRTCSICHITEKVDCTYNDATLENLSCSQQQIVRETCIYCNAARTITLPPREHTWNTVADDSSTHTRTCSVCKKTEKYKHDYENSNICDACGFDGLNYELAVGRAGYVVKDDNNVLNAERIKIPAMHEEKPVVGIKASAFTGNNTIISVELPYTLIEIGEYAFMNCKALQEITIREADETQSAARAVVYASQLTKIGNNAFFACKTLVTFNLPDSVRQIGDYAFEYCENFAHIHIPAEVTEIGTAAFLGTAFFNDASNWNGKDNKALYINKNLIRVNPNLANETEFEIEAGTTTIGSNAFENCTWLKKITIPTSVTTSNSDAFLGCTGLNEVVYKGKYYEWMAINFKNDAANPVHINMNTVNFNIEKATGEITIDSNITSIPSGTFRNTEITKVTISSSVTSIGAYAFYGCSQLKEIVLNDTDNITSIGVDAFTESAYAKDESNWENGVLYLKTTGSSCYAVDAKPEQVSGSLMLKDNTILIATETFKNCTNLTSITIPYTVRTIGARAFNGCSSLTSATFQPNGEKAAKFMCWTMRGGMSMCTSVTFTEANVSTAAQLLKDGTNDWKRVY